MAVGGAAWFDAPMARVVARRFDFADSRAIGAFVMFACGATAALVAALPLPAGWRGLTAALVIAAGARTLARSREAIVGMVVRSDGTVVALRADGRALAGALADGCVVLPAFAAIAWRATGERRRGLVAVPRDVLAPEAHRALRVMLRYATSGEDAEPPESHARASISRALSFFGWPARRWR